MHHLPPARQLLRRQLRILMVMTASLLVEGGIVLLTGFALGLGPGTRHRSGPTFLRLFHGGGLVPVRASLADLAAAEGGALFALVLFLLTIGAGAFELLVHELALIVLDGLAQLDLGVVEAEAGLVEGRSLEGAA